MVCLDSDIIIDFLRKEKEATRKIIELKNNNITLATTAVNSFELFKGALRSKQKDAIDSLSGLLNSLKILDFNLSASKKAAEILEELRIEGNVIDHSDLMIASIAIVNNETLMTRNIKHFERMRELKIL